MRFSLIAVPAFALAVNAVALPQEAADPQTTTAHASATAAPPATYSNSKAALASAVSEMEKKSPAPTGRPTTTVHVTGAPPSTGKPKATSIVKVSPSKPAPKKPKTTSTASPKKINKATSTASAKKGKATPAEKKRPAVKRQNIPDCGQMVKTYDYTPSANFTSNKAILTNFYNDTVLNSASKAASAPSGYSWVWQGFYASANRDYYMSYMPMSSYNVTACAAICDNTPYCRSFNIFYERTPSLAPAAACPNPTAFTAIRCTFWNALLKPTDATNYGEWRQTFPVIITGSNAYTKG